MTNSIKRAIRVAITDNDRRQARLFSKNQSNSILIDRIYLNTLAVLAVQKYCQMMRIDYDQAKSYSSSIANCLIGNTADLFIPECNGRVECRPVLPGAKNVAIPQELWTDRIGYLVVEIDDERSQAVVLGFFAQVNQVLTPLDQAQPLEDFFDAIESYTSSEILWNELQSWLEGKYEAAWRKSGTFLDGDFVLVRSGPGSEAVYNKAMQLYARDSSNEALKNNSASLTDTNEMLAYIIRSTNDEGIRKEALDILKSVDPEHEIFNSIREKSLSLFIDSQNIILRVGFIQRIDERYSVLIQIYSEKQSKALPKGLKLVILDEKGEERFSYPARSQEYLIHRPLIFDKGDSFSIRVSLDGVGTTEFFEI